MSHCEFTMPYLEKHAVLIRKGEQRPEQRAHGGEQQHEEQQTQDVTGCLHTTVVGLATLPPHKTCTASKAASSKAGACQKRFTKNTRQMKHYPTISTFQHVHGDVL